jgi:hypothetical protein
MLTACLAQPQRIYTPKPITPLFELWFPRAPDPCKWTGVELPLNSPSEVMRLTGNVGFYLMNSFEKLCLTAYYTFWKHPPPPVILYSLAPLFILPFMDFESAQYNPVPAAECPFSEASLNILLLQRMMGVTFKIIPHDRE